MELKLTRPIIFFDLETTGINITHDRIVEISLIKVMPGGEEMEKSRRINPQIPIPAEATAVHHITDEDVADCPTFNQIAKNLSDLFDGCDIAGYNSNKFDIPMLDQEFRRAGIKHDFTQSRFVDVQTIFHKKEQRTLVAAYRFYCDKDLEGAHSATADTRATYEVLKGQLDRYGDLPNDIEALSDYTAQQRTADLMGRIVYDDQGREVFNFGKHKGRLVEDVLHQEPGYYNWMMQGDFPANTKDVLTSIKFRMDHR